MTGPDSVLGQLAAAYGIATEYLDWRQRPAVVSEQTIRGVLFSLGVDAGTPRLARQALDSHQQEPWTRMLPVCLVIREGRSTPVVAHITSGQQLSLQIELETGGSRDIPVLSDQLGQTRRLDGRTITEVSVPIPVDLPLGYHTVQAHCLDQQASMPLIITPAWLGLPDRMADRRGWGLATQLYSVRSEQSWGVGDLADLTDLTVWSAAAEGADFILVNPLHAAGPMAPMEPSPYLPATRRFVNPLYLRVERIGEYAEASDAERAQVAALLTELRQTPGLDDQIDRDSAWTAKRAAAKIIHSVRRTAGRQLDYLAFLAREGPGLQDYATWCALAEHHGDDWTSWPDELRSPQCPAVPAFRDAHRHEVDFHCWLQWVLDEQLSSAQAAGVRAGMGLGILHDLAVGVHPRGADTWAMQDLYASGMSVGAPPDAYNQLGQDWSQPPWRPDRLAELAYAPFRQLVAAVLRHAGGVRVDHVIGLFRLWWIPAGAGPGHGTYVRYDHEALVGILALEASRAGALVIGEDLGTVEPSVRDYLAERGILGTSILWFETDHQGDGAPLAPEKWREYCLASVTTHDLPPTAGYLAGDHVRLRERLGVLTRPLAEELEIHQAGRRAWLDQLRSVGALSAGSDAGEETTVLALHRYLTWTPARLICVALTDAVGDRRTQNQPGTVDEYPNWRVPLSDPAGEPMMLEDVLTSRRVKSLVEIVRDGVASPRPF